MQAPFAPGNHKHSCSECQHRHLCLPVAMDSRDIHKLDAIIQRSKVIHAGEHLYSDGENFTSIFAVHSGSIKTFIIDTDGVEHITGFYLPGEITGFDGIGSNSHGSNVVAMETSTACRIPFQPLVELAQKIPALQQHLFKLMGCQIATDFKIMFSLGKQKAAARIATLLVSLSRRFGVRNYSSLSYRLPMSRMDIANFLGLTLETVSRTFGGLHRANIIHIHGRDLLISDPAQLEKLSLTEAVLPDHPLADALFQHVSLRSTPLRPAHAIERDTLRPQRTSFAISAPAAQLATANS